MASNDMPPRIANESKDLDTIRVSEKDTTSDLEPSTDKVLDNAANEHTVDTNSQAGVQKAKAITIAWTHKALIMAYIAIWFVYFVQGIVTGVSNALLPYVTSDFASHSLIPTMNVVSSVIGGVTNLCIAKILDISGRHHGFILCVGLATIGLVIAASCDSVELYGSSQISYTVGVNGVGYCLSVFVADTTSLRHRGLVQALLTSPYIVTSWLVGPISTAFLNRGLNGWRWAFGMESILLPSVGLPLFGLFIFQYRKAKREGIVPPRVEHERTPSQSIIHYVHEFDVLGLLLLSAGFAFLLLPFNLYTMQAKG